MKIMAWANVFMMIINLSFSLFFYCKSTHPTTLSRKKGEKAITLCARYRKISSWFMLFYTLQYAVYFFYPVSIPKIPGHFPWPWWISALIGIMIAVPSGMLLYKGIRYAGHETMHPGKKQRLFRGIYKKIRHPQAVGEVPFFWVISFLLHSPFLAIFSFICVPVFFIMCYTEEKDLNIRYGSRYAKYKQNTGMFFPKKKVSLKKV